MLKKNEWYSVTSDDVFKFSLKNKDFLKAYLENYLKEKIKDFYFLDDDYLEHNKYVNLRLLFEDGTSRCVCFCNPYNYNFCNIRVTEVNQDSLNNIETS